MSDPIDKSPIPTMALIGMWSLGIGLLAVLFSPLVGIILIFAGLGLGVAPQRP